MTDDVDMVVASPYHPRGKVVGVPPGDWLSRGWRRGCIGLVMRNKLHTYTSCVRVYRKSAVVDLPVSHGGFVGVVELLWQLDRRGGTIAECPAVLTRAYHGPVENARRPHRAGPPAASWPRPPGSGCWAVAHRPSLIRMPLRS